METLYFGKNGYCLRFHNDSINMLVNTNEENYSNNATKTCSNALKISRNIKIKYLFHTDVYFQAVGTPQTICPNVFSTYNYIFFTVTLYKLNRIGKHICQNHLKEMTIICSSSLVTVDDYL